MLVCLQNACWTEDPAQSGPKFVFIHLKCSERSTLWNKLEYQCTAGELWPSSHPDPNCSQQEPPLLDFMDKNLYFGHQKGYVRHEMSSHFMLNNVVRLEQKQPQEIFF